MARGAKQGPERMAAVQEGCRWLYNPPTGADFNEWFKNNVVLHEGLNHEDYAAGIVLIPNKETIRYTNAAGEIIDAERLSFSPYPQVETRVRYFWDWCRVSGYLGKIRALPASHRAGAQHLPNEQFVMRVAATGNKEYSFIGASYQVEVLERDPRGGTRPVMEPPPGTKMVPMHGRFGPDVNAPMKAQTGAIGRALGYAGMLILPGSGVSSAEDMQELTQTGPQEAQAPATPAPPEPSEVEQTSAPEQPTEDLMPRIAEMIVELEANFPEEFKQVKAWAKERNLDLENPPAQVRRGLATQLTRKLAAAKRSVD